MIVESNMRHVRWLAVAAVAMACGAHAACNNPNNWLLAPDADTKAFVGYVQQQPAGFADASGTEPFPAPLPASAIGLEKFENDGSKVSYYEITENNSWRICRIDGWTANELIMDSINKSLAQKLSAQYSATNSQLKKLATGYWLSSSKVYLYDKNGRLERVSNWFFGYGRSSIDDTYCYRYDEKGRLILQVEPINTKLCPKGDPDPRDAWLIVNPDARQNETVESARREHSGKPDGSWVEEFSPFFTRIGSGFVRGAAKANSKNGVTEIYGSNAGKLDDNAANTVVDTFGRWDGSTYVFLEHPIPLTVIDNPDFIYKYRRRRQTYVDGNSVRLYELFEPNEHIARNRYYLFDGYVMRQEKLNAQGKVTRVITIDDYRQPRPGPHPDVDDKRLTDKGLHVHGHQIYHRVYDIDGQGQPKLVAVSWGRDFWLPGMKETPVDWAQVVYGTPDGKERWKTQEDFEQAFGTSERAAQVFPDKQGTPSNDGQ